MVIASHCAPALVTRRNDRCIVFNIGEACASLFLYCTRRAKGNQKGASFIKCTLMIKLELEAKIPIRPHLLKFLLKVENMAPGEKLNLDSGGAIPFFVQFLLCNKCELMLKDRYQSKRKPDQIPADFSATVTVKVSTNFIPSGRIFISYDSVFQLDRYLHKMMHDFLNDRIQRGDQTEKQAIMEFMDEFNITEDDISFDAIKKATQRLRTRKKIDGKRKQKRQTASNP